jgi:CHAT domain-containing protein
MYEVPLAPASEQLSGKTRLTIIPDWSLWYLPFSALQSAENRFVTEHYALTFASSLTASYDADP